MSDLRPKHTEIELGGKKYGMLFDFNAIDEIQDRFDISIANLPEYLRDERRLFKSLKTLLTILINEAIDDAENGESHVTENFIGRKLTVAEIPALKDKIFMAFASSVPTSEDDDAPNAQSA